ncbi:glycosyltransferase family 2 protein [Phlebopus sp. FC_14]|nr:glycosyltransferase family 2 protein [Phlebopus sp. FC_14]
MGGMGTIHEANDSIIYKENSLMTINMLTAALDEGVHTFFYASSACVYPEGLQNNSDVDVSLKESDVWACGAPKPQGLYGLEKLVSELLLHQTANKLEVRIARFHNVFGPRGAWKNGREKVPAALLRKALAIRLGANVPTELEIWGDGTQRRIVGVASRNANNAFVKEVLKWEPKISLEDGMRKTAEWMEGEMKEMLAKIPVDKQSAALLRLQSSEVIDLAENATTFAVLLPITTRGLASPNECLSNLRKFAQSLARTTWRDTRQVGGLRFHVKVYLAIDEVDSDILHKDGAAEHVLVSEGVYDVTTDICTHAPGHVCAIWRQIARRAWEDGCDYFVLMGDDVVLKDEGWMRDADAEFVKIAENHCVPRGFGCVAFTDITFPGMPTFPILHRTHLDIFEGDVIPEIFFNQDGDPFLYQLYRRWGCSTMFPSCISNGVGGSSPARYTQTHADGWTFDTLDHATVAVEMWLSEYHPRVERKVTIDVVVPSYRVQMRFLDPILNLQPSPTCTVMFVVIIDNPSSASCAELEAKYGSRPDVRIRVNEENLGASASRNRGMKESAAEWVLFLDDDITPKPDILVEAEKVVRAHPKAAGFIGNSLFPTANSIFTTAVHLAGVTYFWDIAAKMPEERDMPWGVTANLMARRVRDGVEYSVQFPKTGGGEDIDFCRQKRAFSIAHGGEGYLPAPDVVVTHPYWDGGRRSYWRFYMWSKGDGALIKLYPELTYMDHAPNSAEMLLISASLAALGLVTYPFVHNAWLPAMAGYLAMSTIVANIAHDLYRHVRHNSDRTKAIKSTVTGIGWFLAVVESSLIRMASECGRVVGLLERKELLQLGRRFDWFTGRAGDGPMNEERMNARQRFFLLVNIMIVLVSVRF